MTVKVQAITGLVEQLAPKYLAEEWDNVGLQVGDPAGEVNKVLVTLDVDEQVVEEAIRQDVDLIVAHHPMIFKGIKNIRYDQPLGCNIINLIGNGIAVYAAHTNLDSAEEGINALLAQLLDLEETQVLEAGYHEKYIKLVVFVPQGSEDKVREALTTAGAGHIGQYSHCTFQTEGTGTFKPLEGTKPYLGKVGQLEKAAEYRLETIIPEALVGKVVKAMLKAHPYEEVAYDLYPLLNEGKTLGLGRIGTLSEPVSLEGLAAKVKTALKLDHVRIGGPVTQKISKVALCGGSGTSLTSKAAFKGADVLLTGDIKYHEAQDILARGMCFIDAGHNGTERIIVPVLAHYLREKASQAKWEVEIIESSVNTDPFVTV